MKLFSEIEKEYKRVREILDEDDEIEDIDKKLTCCERATWESWAEALTFCMYAEGETP
jgi:hypothetical protein